MPGASRKTSRQPAYIVRRSTIHGHGVFARRRIRRGTRIIEYLGERISPEEAEARGENGMGEPGIVLLFTVDKRTLIDAGRGGNAARFINHSCSPNCEAVLDDGRVFIESCRSIVPGEELTYDYHLAYEGAYTPRVLARYRCRCGAPDCRGTMLEPRRARPRRGQSAAKRPSRSRGVP
jgi:SET domain-containing protein